MRINNFFITDHDQWHKQNKSKAKDAVLTANLILWGRNIISFEEISRTITKQTSRPGEIPWWHQQSSIWIVKIQNFQGKKYWEDLGPLHILWQIYFGCWVTWSISIWKEYHKSVFFLIAKWTSFSVSQQLRSELSAKWIGKIDALVNFIIWKFARLKSKQFSQFFWWEVNPRGLRAFIL